jgi:hypothetical protein
LLFHISWAFGQDMMPYFWAVQSNVSTHQKKLFEDKIVRSLEKLQNKKVRIHNEKQFLQHTFNYIHTHYLKTYQKEANFYDIVSKGYYNCVSGNILFAYFLEKIGYQYQVYEADNHVFMIVSLSEKDRILVESTAFFGEGMIDDEKKIDEELSKLRPTGTASLMNLAGMQFYNEAVLAFQDQKYLESLSLSNKAYYFYPSEKVKNLYQISKQKLSEQVVSR